MVVGAPESRAASVDTVGIGGIEGEGGDAGPQVEHTPGLASVVGDVVAGHVATQEDKIGIGGADGWVDRGSAASGTDDGPGVETGGGTGALCGGNER